VRINLVFFSSAFSGQSNQVTREPICVVVLTNDQTSIHGDVLDLSSVVKWWWGKAKDPIKILLKKKKRKECTIWNWFLSFRW